MAAAEWESKVLVQAGTTFKVGDHDFTKFSIVPSVSLLIDIPERIEDPWYRVLGTRMQLLNPHQPFKPQGFQKHYNLLKQTQVFCFCIVMVNQIMN